MDIANRIKEYRQKAGLTQKAVALRMGCTTHNVYRWEKGKLYPRSSDIERLAIALECEVGDLLSDYIRKAEPAVSGGGLSADQEMILSVWSRLSAADRADVLAYAQNLAVSDGADKQKNIQEFKDSIKGLQSRRHSAG